MTYSNGHGLDATQLRAAPFVGNIAPLQTSTPLRTRYTANGTAGSRSMPGLAVDGMVAPGKLNSPHFGLGPAGPHRVRLISLWPCRFPRGGARAGHRKG